jgi:hypothetical protein
MKDEMSYPLVLQMYINLLNKSGEFRPPCLNQQFVEMVMRKGLESINLEGKRKVLEFIIHLSEIDKVQYGSSACYTIF